MNQKLIDIAQSQKGFIATADVTQASIPRRCLAEAVASGDIQRIERGLYVVPEIWEDEYVIAQHRFARGIFSHETALFLHGMTDQTPEALTMTFPRGYNTAAPSKIGIIPKTIVADLFELGVMRLKTPFDNEVVSYNIERTLCDIVRRKATPDSQLVNPAMKAYVASKDKDINLLLDYASKLGVAHKVRTYMEVML